jgi:pimeloyl-ACP methyl ester carboxylesterase
MTAITHRFIDTNEIRMHIAEAGQGPLVVLLHGFPESWYSWRHQLAALAQAGYHAVAPDQRGYGQTGRPAEIEQAPLLPGCGHWTQQERPAEVNAALLEFLNGLAPVA